MMEISLDSLIDEMLSVEKVDPPPTFRERINNFVRRKEIEKQLQDEREAQNALVLKLGKEAEAFLNSTYYKDLLEPQLRTLIKGGLQKLIREGEGLTESQLKSEIAVVKKSLTIVASIKLKIIQANLIKEKMK